MQGLFIRWIILTFSILLTPYIVDGITVSGFLSAFSTAAALGILNAFFRPVLLILTLPLTLLTMGLFTFVINAILLLMASGVIPGFEVRSFWDAIWGAIVISIFSWVLNMLVSPKGKIEVIRFTRYDKH